jgi:hypothetical protein
MLTLPEKIILIFTLCTYQSLSCVRKHNCKVSWQPQRPRFYAPRISTFFWVNHLTVSLLSRHKTMPPCPDRVSNHMPQRGLAYQPRVPTLGIHLSKLTRVLKERRRLSVSRTSTPAHPMRCSYRTHLFSGMGSQSDALGWYALPRWGKWPNSRLIRRVSAESFL